MDAAARARLRSHRFRAPGLVLGFGHPQRGDDAVGPLVVERLRKWLPPMWRAESAGDDRARWARLLADYESLITIDAMVAPEHPEGSLLLRWPERAAPDTAESLKLRHGMGPRDLLGRAHSLALRVPGTLCVDVVAAHFDLGAAICPAVLDAVAEIEAALYEVWR